MTNGVGRYDVPVFPDGGTLKGIDCKSLEKLPPLIFNIGEYEYSIDPSVYAYWTTEFIEGKSICVIMTYKHKHNYIGLPENYLRGIQIVHDMEGLRIGLTPQREKKSNTVLYVCVGIGGAVLLLIIGYLVIYFIKQWTVADSPATYINLSWQSELK